MIDASAGFVFLNEGGAGMPLGRSGIAAAICVCTSTRGALDVAVERELERDVGCAGRAGDVMSSRPAIDVNWRSSGLATVDAIAAGSPPGSPALTLIVG